MGKSIDERREIDTLKLQCGGLERRFAERSQDRFAFGARSRLRLAHLEIDAGSKSLERSRNLHGPVRRDRALVQVALCVGSDPRLDRERSRRIKRCLPAERATDRRRPIGLERELAQIDPITRSVVRRAALHAGKFDRRNRRAIDLYRVDRDGDRQIQIFGQRERRRLDVLRFDREFCRMQSMNMQMLVEKRARIPVELDVRQYDRPLFRIDVDLRDLERPRYRALNAAQLDRRQIILDLRCKRSRSRFAGREPPCEERDRRREHDENQQQRRDQRPEPSASRTRGRGQGRGRGGGYRFRNHNPPQNAHALSLSRD